MSESIFKECLSEWGNDRVDFIHWCGYYHNILMRDEKPTDYVFDNDILLDRWVEDQEGRQRHQARGGKSASSHQEVIEFG